jgi:hypothetical protein
MGLFNQKRVWHSHMKTVSPLVLKFKTTVMDSKYVPDQRIIYFDCMGDDLDGKHYVCESPEIDAILQQVQKDTWLRLAAFGGGDNEGPAGMKIEAYEGETPAVATKPQPGAASTTVPTGSSIAPSLMQQDYSKDNVEDTYYECLSLAAAVQERFKEEVGRKMTAIDLELAQHMFAHWAIKGFDRPMYLGQQPKGGEAEAEEVEEANGEPMAGEDQFDILRSLAKISADSDPSLADEVEERIEQGMTEGEAGEYIRELALPRGV